MAVEKDRLRRLLSALYDDTPDAVVLYDLDGAVVSANESAQMLAGFTAAELAGSSFRKLVSADDLERVEVAVQSALAGGTDHFETHARHKSGSAVPVEVYVFPAIVDGKVVGIFSQARDIVALKSAEEALGVNQERFRSLFEYHPDGIMELKADGSISRVNVALESETGFYGEQIFGKEWTELIAPEFREAASGALRAAMRGESAESESMLLDRLGNRIDVGLKLVPLHVRETIGGAYAIFRNIAPQKTAERAIETQTERIRRLYVVTASRGGSIDDQIDATLALGLELFGFDCAYVTHFEDDRITVRNAAGDKSVSKGAVYPVQFALSRHLQGDRRDLIVPDMDAPEWRDDPARATAPWRSYFALQLRLGETVYGALVFASRVPRHDGFEARDLDLLNMIGLSIASALERAAQSARIEQLAFNDALTGLPNRVLFDDRISHTIATARRYNRGFAVFFVDLDKFKAINDGFGHPIGDRVLVAVAQKLRATLRDSDTVARVGGDEFVILQPIVDGPTDASDLARKIHSALQEQVVVDGVAHDVRASIGIALFPWDGTTEEDLLAAADRALYSAKREGRNRWQFADPEAARRNLTARPRSAG